MRSGGWKTCTLAIRYLDPMDAENVVLIPACGECDAVWLPADEDRWAAYLTDDEPARGRLLGPRCAEQEFAGD